MSGEFRITDDEATLHAPLAEAARVQLRERRPSSLELVGDWNNLTVLSEIAPGVARLTISGDLQRGRIIGAEGLNRFSSLRYLHFASEVKAGYDLADLPVLEDFEGAWQAEAKTAFSHRSLRSVSLRGFPHADFSQLGASAASVLAKLWLSNSKLENLQGIGRLAALSELRITDAKKLASLQGLDSPALEILDIENASKLANLDGLAGATRLKRLRLLSTGSQVDLSPIDGLQDLESLQVGGRIASDINWEGLVALRNLKRVFAWWDPTSVPENRIRVLSAQAGKSIARFEPVPGKGRRPLLVEWA